MSLTLKTLILLLSVISCKSNPAESSLSDKGSDSSEALSCSVEKKFTDFWDIQYVLSMDSLTSNSVKVEIWGMPTSANASASDKQNWCDGCELNKKEEQTTEGEVEFEGQTKNENALIGILKGSSMKFIHFKGGVASDIVNELDCEFPATASTPERETESLAQEEEETSEPSGSEPSGRKFEYTWTKTDRLPEETMSWNMDLREELQKIEKNYIEKKVMLDMVDKEITKGADIMCNHISSFASMLPNFVNKLKDRGESYGELEKISASGAEIVSRCPGAESANWGG